ncbi:MULTISPECIES: cytoplasmic protein [Acidovorax]|uniref:Cytoplasmic protein n=1 Tax=Acidovorax soli TaxID=592050 RepID=A0A1H4AY37_9BURK|nr:MULTISPECIES: cytoplasmic protein [Acidovorax]SEA40801.1 hypothetical protein SAMN05421875_1128 [Acidovorax soli]
MIRIVLGLVFALQVAGAGAQNAVATDGDKYKVILENPCVRVLDYRDQPGDKTHQHHHPGFVLYALSAFERMLTLPDGKVLRRSFKAGDVMWSDAQTHIGENIGTTPTHVVIVEMKSAPVAGSGACVVR